MSPFQNILNETNVRSMKERHDIAGLIRALKHQETRIQWEAAEALGELGKEDITPLVAAIRRKNRDVRLGVIEAFGRIKDPSTVPILIEALSDKSPEVRWEGALALGEIGETSAIPALVQALRDADKYVRYGAAQALQALRWIPRGESEQAYLFLGKQEWERLVALGEAAVEPLCIALADRDESVRTQAAECLGRIGSSRAIPDLYQALRDETEDVRWHAVVAARTCGMPLMRLPFGLSKRPRRRQSPGVAAFLNFVLPGMGYLYIGRWWGIVLFQIDVYVTLLLLTSEGNMVADLLLLPIYILLAAHAWYMARKLLEL